MINMGDFQALLVIDMQNGLLRRKVFNKQALIDNLNDLLNYFHQKDMPVFFTRHTNDSFSKENSNDWQISNELNILCKDIIINKSHSSICKEKQFISLLKEKSITGIVIAGLVSNGCIQAACLDAKKLGLSVILIGDGHSTFHKDGESVVRYWNEFLQNEGIKVVTTFEFKN